MSRGRSEEIYGSQTGNIIREKRFCRWAVVRHKARKNEQWTVGCDVKGLVKWWKKLVSTWYIRVARQSALVTSTSCVVTMITLEEWTIDCRTSGSYKTIRQFRTRQYDLVWQWVLRMGVLPVVSTVSSTSNWKKLRQVDRKQSKKKKTAWSFVFINAFAFSVVTLFTSSQVVSTLSSSSPKHSSRP